MKQKESIFRELYSQYRQHWYLICLRYQTGKMQADDAFQNGLIKIFNNYHQYDDQKGNFKSWSSRVMINENLMLIRKNKSTFAFDELANCDMPYDRSEGAIERMSMEELVVMIQNLPDGYRSVFNLYVIEGYSHKEISEMLNISVGTSKSQLYKARKILQTEIQIVL